MITWLSVRSRRISRVVKTQPTLLLRDGQYRRQAMQRVRVTEDEILSVIRQHGLGSVEQVAAVVLETDGSMSVISTNLKGKLDTLQGVDSQPASKGEE